MRLFRPNIAKMMENKDVRGLIKALSDKDPKVREAAARALREIKKWYDWEPYLAGVGVHARTVAKVGIHASGILVQKAMADASRKFDPYPVVERLCAALTDDSSEVSYFAASSLGEIGDVRAVEPLLAALRSGKDRVRDGAASALGKIGSPQAVQVLIDLLKDEDLCVLAAEGLWWARDRLAIEPLCATLNTANESLRVQSIKVLRLIPNARVVEALCTALHDDNPNVRQNAVWALEEIAEGRAVQPHSDYDSAVRERARRGLEQVRGGK